MELDCEVTLVTSVVDEAPPPTVPVGAKIKELVWAEVATLRLEEATVLEEATTLAAAVVPAELSPDPPAVAVGKEPESWVWDRGTQPLEEMLAKLGVAPVKSFSAFGPGSGKTTSVPGVVLQVLMDSRLATKSSG